VQPKLNGLLFNINSNNPNVILSIINTTVTYDIINTHFNNAFSTANFKLNIVPVMD